MKTKTQINYPSTVADQHLCFPFAIIEPCYEKTNNVVFEQVGLQISRLQA